MTILKKALLGWGVLAWAWTGCGPDADPDVVARIGERKITLEQLRQFRGDATANYRDPEEGLKAWRFYLETMIDMELMLAEARAEDLGRDLAFERKWLDERRKKLVDAYSAQTIAKEVDLAVDDMRASFAGSKWDKMLQLAHVRTASEAEAQKAMRDLEQGRDFAEVARDRSVVPVTAQRGGLLSTWFGRGNLEEMGLSVEIGEALFELDVGDFSQPFQVGEFYEIFKVLAEGPAPDHYRASFLRARYWEEFRAQWESLVDRLRERMDVRVQGESIKVLVERMTGAGRGGMLLGPEDRNVILATFDGGQVTVEDFAETYNAYWFIRSVSFDSSGIAEFIHRDLMPRTLVYHAALEEGLDRDSTIVAWLDGKKESMLLDALRDKEVVQQVVLDSAEVRAYYDANPQLFMQFEEIEVTEVLVATHGEAERLLQQVRAGGDLLDMAARHTIRADVEGGHYHMHNHPSERRVFGAFFDTVEAAKIGALNGPIELEEGFSVFRVEQRTPPRPVPYAEAVSRAEWWVQKQQETALFDQLFTRLREKYADRVTLFEERLGALAEN